MKLDELKAMIAKKKADEEARSVEAAPRAARNDLAGDIVWDTDTEVGHHYPNNRGWGPVSTRSGRKQPIGFRQPTGSPGLDNIRDRMVEMGPGSTIVTLICWHCHSTFQRLDHCPYCGRTRQSNYTKQLPGFQSIYKHDGD